MSTDPEKPTHKFLLVIGAGISGVVLGAEVHRQKVLDNPLDEMIIFDRNGGYGGVWWANTYPGAACDIVSHIYSISWFPNPSWSHRYSPQDEIRRYYEDLAARYSLGPCTRFRHTVLSAHFSDETLLWSVAVLDETTNTVRYYTANVVVSAIGQLNRPKLAPILGKETFAGPAFHTAEWDKTVDLEGKRVAVIGTGPSAGQVIPEIAGKVKELHVYQRSPPHVLPRGDYAFPRWVQWCFRWIPGAWWLHHMWLFIKEEITPYRASHVASETNLSASAVCQKHLYAQIPPSRQDLRDKLTPQYPFGCKRPLFLDNYHPTFLQPNVYLHTDRPIEITPTSIISRSTPHPDPAPPSDWADVAGDDPGTETPIDVIIWATGFLTQDLLGHVDVRGHNGVSLKHQWGDTAQAFLGTSVHNFPNLLLQYGPATGLLWGSLTFMFETQALWNCAVIRRVYRQAKKGCRVAYAVKEEVEREYNEEVQRKLAVLAINDGRCTSFYKNERGVVTTNYPWRLTDYWWRLLGRGVRWELYDCLSMDVGGGC